MKLFCTLAENRMSNTNKTERKLFYARILIMLYLHNGQYQRARELEKCIQSNPDLNSQRRFTIGDFQPSGFEYSGERFRVVIDSRVLDLSEYFLLNIETVTDWLTVNFPDMQTQTTFFFMDGSGPSPFNGNLNDVYLKVGHYRKRANDCEIVIHAIVHEIIHLYLRNTLGFRVCPEEFGIRKFFDEGFAQLCGFRAANALDRKRAHANTCARAVTVAGLSSLGNKITDWNATIFQMRYYPLYQSALSFVVYLEEQYGNETLVELFRSSSCDKNFNNIVVEKFGIAFQNLLESWAENLSDISSAEETEFFEIVKTKRADPQSLQVEYSSEFSLYPPKDILVYNGHAKQLPVSSRQRFRYQEKGLFTIECPANTHLDFIIAFDNKLQNISIEKCP